MPKRAGKNGTTNGHAEPDNAYKIEGILLWKYRALDSEYVRIQSEQKNTHEKIQEFIERTPELKDLYARRAELLNSGSLAAKELQDVVTEIEKMLNIDLKGCSIDDKTGVIHVLENGVEVPMTRVVSTVSAAEPEAVKKSKTRQAGSARR